MPKRPHPTGRTADARARRRWGVALLAAAGLAAVLTGAVVAPVRLPGLRLQTVVLPPEGRGTPPELVLYRPPT